MVVRTSTARLQEFHLQELEILVDIIKQHIRVYMPDIVGLITELWGNPALHLPIVSLVESLGRALDAEFKPFLPTILPLTLKVFDSGFLNDKHMNTQMKILDTILTFGANIEEYLHLVIPVIVKTFEREVFSDALRKHAMQTIAGLSRKVDLSSYASRIVHSLLRVLRSASAGLRTAVMDTLCSLIVQLGSDFVIFVPIINKVCILSPHRHISTNSFRQCMLSQRISFIKYENLVTKLWNGENLIQEAPGIGLL
jgi:serine/threonine-protein kinase mTOR